MSLLYVGKAIRGRRASIGPGAMAYAETAVGKRREAEETEPVGRQAEQGEVLDELLPAGCRNCFASRGTLTATPFREPLRRRVRDPSHAVRVRLTSG